MYCDKSLDGIIGEPVVLMGWVRCDKALRGAVEIHVGRDDMQVIYPKKDA